MSIPRFQILCTAAALTATAIAGCGAGTKSVTRASSVSVTESVADSGPTTVPVTTTTSSSAPAKAPTRTGSSSTASGDPVTVKGRTGDTLALQGDGLGSNGPTTKSRLQVTLKDVRGPFAGFDIPAGEKLVGLDLHMANVGAVRYSDPLPDGTLTLTGGETGKFTSLIAVSGTDPCPHPSLNLAHGQSKDFCEAFEVPKDAKLEAFEYATDSGYGDTGLWRLGG